jgi:hypothetical protein
VNLNRILISTTTDITVTFYVGGTPTSLDGAVSVNAVNTAGTVVISGGVGIPTGTAGEYRYKLTPTAGTGTLDTLTVVWAGLLNGDPETVTTRVEIVGGFVFTIAEARALSGLGGARSDINQDSSYKISTARLVAARTEVERALEQELGFAMVPRYTRATLDGNGATVLPLAPYPRLIRSVTVGGTALAPANISMTPSGFLYYPSGWTDGWQNVVIGYEHGLDYPPARAKDVALALARRALSGSPADDRATSMSTEQETTTFYVPGSSEPFDVPAANRFVAANTLRTGIA